MKKILFVLLVAVMILQTSLVCAKTAEGSIGTVETQGRKRAYSNYFHPTKVHRSSVSIGTLYVDSGWVPAKQTSFASAVGKWGDTTKAYYDYKD